MPDACDRSKYRDGQGSRRSSQQVESVTSTTTQNAAFIPEYLLPQMRHLATDSDVFVRVTYARGLVRLAEAAVNMLEMSQATKVSRSEVEFSGIPEVSSHHDCTAEIDSPITTRCC